MAEYTIDVRIYGTLYIEADSEAEALEMARATEYEFIHLGRDLRLDDGVKLSSAMTIHGPDEGDTPSLSD